MLALTKPDRVIYGSPPNLALEKDTVAAAPFGITPAADSAARPVARDTTARRDSAR
jgi:hypothetical protein